MKIRIVENADEYIMNLTEDVLSEFEYNTYTQIINYSKGDTIDWDVVPSGRLSKIWKDYSKSGFVNDIKGLNNIKHIIESNILKLEYTNALLGHDSYLPQEEWTHTYEIDDEELERINDILWKIDFCTYRGQDLISDYGLPQLKKYLLELVSTNIPEEQLVIIDKMLNVIHPRNDLSLFFIEGGKHTLNKLFLESKKSI